VDCGAYIEHFLSAHADGELAGEELRSAEEHVAECARCREALEAERALKRLLREHLSIQKAPTQIRDRVHIALDREQAVEIRSAARGASRARTLLRPRVWIPAAIAALLIIGLSSLTRLHTLAPPGPEETPLQEATSTDSVPMFVLAAHHLDSFQRKFEPNVPSGSPADISDAYLAHKMPGYLWNFGPFGYQLVGGRLEPMPDGQTVAFTYYRGEKGGILCTYMHYSGPFPPGAVHQTDSHSFYEYRGYSICISKYPRGDFICMLISRLPLADFMETVSQSAL
jgi:hypothetical protein